MKHLTRRTNPAEFINLVWKNNVRNFGSLIRERLSDKDKESFIDLIENNSRNPYKDYMIAQQESGQILQEILPTSLQENLRNIGNNGRSILLLQNCPIIGRGRTLPKIPTTSKKSDEKDYISEYFMLGISNLIDAVPYLIEGVRDSNIINQMIPTDPYSNSGSGSKIPFGLHNEVVHETRVPDHFILLALKGNPMAKTTYCFLDDIIPFLPSQILDELKKPNFLMKSGDKSVFKEAKEVRCPVITIDKNGSYDIRYNMAPGRCEGITNEAKIALNYLNHCLNNDVPIHGIALSDGEAIIVPNKKTLHGRSEFEGNRWIQRMNLITNQEKQNSGRS